MSKPEQPAVKEITLEKKGEGPSIGFRPANFEELWRFANLIAKTDMVPDQFRNKPGEILAAVQMGHELGLPPMQSLQTIAVINGRPTLWGDGALAIARAHPLCEWIEELEPSKTVKVGMGRCIVKRRDQEEPICREFTIDMAKTAHLWGGDRARTQEGKQQSPWSTYPGRMLQMRARAWAIRDALPEAMKGVAIREEVIDLPTAKPELKPPQRLSAPVIDIHKEPDPPEVEGASAEEPAKVDPDDQGDIFPLKPEPGSGG